MLRTPASTRVEQHASQFARRTAGFTLVEMMVVLVIVGIILALAMPAFSKLSLVTRLKSYANEMISTVNLARGEAIKRNTAIRVCMSADGENCTTSGDWDQGWIVMDPNDLVLTYKDGVDNGFQFKAYTDPNDPGSTAVSQLTFDPSGVGVSLKTSGGDTVGTAIMNICRNVPSVGHQEKQVVVFASGRSSVSTTTLSTCDP